MTLWSLALSEPIIMNGAMVPSMLGVPMNRLRVVNGRGAAVPFQIDEITPGGEYICPSGEKPNRDSANGVLDKQDEIVFLWEDADSANARLPTAEHVPEVAGSRCGIAVSHGLVVRHLWIVDDSAVPLSPVRYIDYNDGNELLQTPYYYAQFAPARFHFTRAGIMDFVKGKYRDLTNELRVEIVLKTLFGIIPINYSEKSMVCTVIRYKAGPLRLIRRGDFYLKLGLWLKGNRAIVYQMCYPQAVKAPVEIHLPPGVGTIFSTAYIEMTPVIRSGLTGFNCGIPGISRLFNLSSPVRLDTLIRLNPDAGYMVSGGREGYVWLSRMDIPDSLRAGSGYVVRRPSKRGGAAECGVRFAVRDLPKGTYSIVNYVFFPRPLPIIF